MALDVDTVFDFDLKPTLASQRNSAVSMGFLCQLSERLLRVLAQYENGTVSMGTPVFQGRS